MDNQLTAIDITFTDAPEDLGPIDRMWPRVYIYRTASDSEWSVLVRFRDGHEVIRCSHSRNRADVNCLALQIIADRYGDAFIREANLEVWKDKLEKEKGHEFEICLVEFSTDYHKVIAHVKRRDTGEIRKWTISYAADETPRQ